MENARSAQELSLFSRPLLTFAATMTIIIMIAGILGNVLTIIALLRCPRVRNVTAAFIISLCVADLLFCIAVLPFSSSRFIHGKWIHGTILCQTFPLMRYGNIGVSLLSIAMITINRYIMIVHHSIYARVYTKYWITMMIAFCWLLSYGMQMPTLFQIWGKFAYDEKLGTCSIMNDKYNRSSKTALFVTAFVIPCIVIVICYARIFWVVHSSETRMREHATQTAPRREAKEQKNKRNEWRITKMVVAIFLSFIVCYLPITIVKVTDRDVRYPGLHVFGYLMLYVSACINPIIYVIMNKQYRQAFKTVLLWQRPRLLSVQTATNASQQEKSRDGYSKTMVSQVSIAMLPMDAHEDSDVFQENDRL